jgi:hypothetical protein
MSLLHVDHPIRAPHCCGNCNQGRSDCTMPGVCTLRQRCRSQHRHALESAQPTDDADTLYTPGDARATRRLLATIVIAVFATAWLIAA